jgi:hypothetical protein
MLHYAVPEQVVDAIDASNSPTTLRNATGKVEPPHTASLENIAQPLVWCEPAQRS